MANDMFGFGGFPNLTEEQKFGAAGIGSGLTGMFGNNTTPGQAANPYLNQFSQQAGHPLNPYTAAGKRAIPGLEEQYSQLLGNPGGKINEIGGSFQQSPGFQFALQQALQGAGHAAAAGGMVGSPEHSQQAMQQATNLANQDYYNWLGQATGLYGQGLQGEQGLAGLGANAATNKSNLIAQQLATQAKLAAEDKKAQNQNWGNAFGNVVGGASTFI
jgi:hypothetical protein